MLRVTVLRSAGDRQVLPQLVQRDLRPILTVVPRADWDLP